MKAVLATCKDYIFQPGAANTGGLQHMARSPECALSCLNLKLGVGKIPHDYVMLLRCSRMPKSVRISTLKHVRATIVAVEKH